MNRNVIIASAFVVAAAGALGLRFGLPAYAEYKVGQVLDAHIAKLPEPSQGMYAGLSLDYWNDRLELSQLQLPIYLPNPMGQPLPAIINVEGIVIDGYDLDALDAARETGTASAAPLIRQVAWDSFTVRGQSGSGSTGSGPAGNGAAGRIDGIRDLTMDLLTGGVIALAFDEMRQEDLSARIPPDMAGGVTVTGTIAAVSLSGAGPDGMAAVGIDGVALTGTEMISGTEGSRTAQVRTEHIGLAGWKRGKGNAAGTIANLQVRDIRLALDLTLEAEPTGQISGPITVALKSYELVNMRYDPFTLDAWASLSDVLADDDVEPVQMASAAETMLTALERARTLDTGFERASIRTMETKVGGISAFVMDQLDIHDARGLRGGRFEILGYHVTDASGPDVTIAEYSGTIGDFADLPDWARMVFGRPITADSLATAAAWAEARPIGELLPDVDLGTFIMKGMRVTAVDEPPLDIGLFAIDRMTTTRAGTVDVAVRMEGIRAPVRGSLEAVPDAATILQMLKANGIEDLSIDMGLSIQASLTDSTGRATVRLAGEDLADVNATVNLAEIDYEQVRQKSPEQLRTVLLTSQLVRAELVVGDLGLRRLFLQGQAAQRPGATADTVGAQFGAMAEQTGASMGTDAARAIGQQLAAFITHGGSLLIQTGLVKPLPVFELMGLQRQPPAQIIDLLGITATHSGP
ncbi:MAG: hypothetical protein P1U65_00330 [Minwuia sp.]|nr:hypothetical protein [Minwuia sp.]